MEKQKSANVSIPLRYFHAFSNGFLSTDTKELQQIADIKLQQ